MCRPKQKYDFNWKKKLRNYKNISWKIATAEKLPFNDFHFDYYVISFGLRNTKN